MESNLINIKYLQKTLYITCPTIFLMSFQMSQIFWFTATSQRFEHVPVPRRGDDPGAVKGELHLVNIASMTWVVCVSWSRKWKFGICWNLLEQEIQSLRLIDLEFDARKMVIVYIYDIIICAVVFHLDPILNCPPIALYRKGNTSKKKKKNWKIVWDRFSQRIYITLYNIYAETNKHKNAWLIWMCISYGNLWEYQKVTHTGNCSTERVLIPHARTDVNWPTQLFRFVGTCDCTYEL